MRAAVNGIDLAYDVEGRPGGPGRARARLPLHARDLAAQAAALAQEYRVLTWDLRGLGESLAGAAAARELRRRPARPDGRARRGARRLVGLRWAATSRCARSSERSRASGPSPLRHPLGAGQRRGQARRAAGIRALHRDGVEPFVRGLLPKLLLRPRPRGPRPVEIMLRNGARDANALAAMQGRTDTTPSLAAIEIPTLIVVGSGDAITPPEVAGASRPASGAPGSRSRGRRHVSNLEAPRRSTLPWAPSSGTRRRGRDARPLTDSVNDERYPPGRGGSHELAAHTTRRRWTVECGWSSPRGRLRCHRRPPRIGSRRNPCAPLDVRASALAGRWKEELSLHDWTIEIECGMNPALKNHLGRVRTTPSTKSARIWIRDGLPRGYQNYVLVHELVPVGVHASRWWVPEDRRTKRSWKRAPRASSSPSQEVRQRMVRRSAARTSAATAGPEATVRARTLEGVRHAALAGPS